MMWRPPLPATLGPMRSRPREEHPAPGVVSESAGDIEETPDLQGAYPRLADAQLTTLAEAGRRRAVQAEEILFREGERKCDFFVILAGKVAVVEGRGTPEERLIGVHGRGRFLGELGLLTGEGSFYTAIAVEAGEVLGVPVARLKEIISRDTALGDLIVRAYLARRAILIDLGAGLRIIGSRYSPDTERVREFAARNRVPYRWLDLETDPAAESLLTQAGVAPMDTPVVIVHGRLLRNPSNAELAAAIGLPAPASSPAGSDLIMVGAGPAGLSAAVYGASEGLRVLVLDGTATGGPAGGTSRIENYLGFPAGISGAELAERAMLQAQKFGAQFAVPAEVKSVRRDDGRYVVTLDDGPWFTAAVVVAASGARYRRLQVPRADYFERMSIYYAASQAEALMCRGDPVVIVGGGNSAGQAAVFLSLHASRVPMVVREADLSENMSRYLIDRVQRIANVDIMLGTEIRELLGDRVLEAVTVEDRQSGAQRTLKARALFVFIGVSPCTGWLGDLVDLDRHGFVRTGRDASGTGWQGSALGTRPPRPFA